MGRSSEARSISCMAATSLALGAHPAGAEVPIGVKRLSISGQLNVLFHPASPKPILGWKSEMIENYETIQLVMRGLSFFG